MAEQKSWIKRPDDMTRVVTLEFPPELGAEGDATGIVDKLTLKRPTVGDILAAGKAGLNEDEKLMHEVARACRQLPSLIEKLYASDFSRLEDAYYELRFPSQQRASSEES